MNRRAFVSAAALLAAAPRAAFARNGEWGSATALPEPRQAFAIASVGTSIYVLGGYSARGQRLNQVYDVSRGTWSERAPVPVSLNFPAAAGVGGSVYLFGGFAESFGVVPGRALGGGFRYNPRADTWTQIEPMPTWRGGFALIESGGKLYALGGRAKLDFSANEVYNPADDTWDTLAPLPEPRDMLAGAALRGEIHVTGGRVYELGGNSARHDVYDPAQDTWTQGPELPKTRSGHAAAVLDGRLLLVGGENNEGMDSDLIAFDPDRSSWQSLATMPHPRHALGAVAVNRSVYAIGGSRDFGLSAPSTLNETFSL